MRAQANRIEDKRFLQEVVEIMKCSKSKIRLDDCGDWNIFGKNSHLYTDGLGVLYLYHTPGSVRKWNNFKNRFSFMDKYVDGDDEGILALYRLPTEQEGELLRKAMKLRISFNSENLVEHRRKISIKALGTEGV